MADAILILEDEAPMRRRLQRIVGALDHAGAAVRCADSIAQAKALAGDEDDTQAPGFALALVDLGLPDGNGVEFVRWLRARDEGLPILVISAWSTEEMIVAALRAGASGYVLKERENEEIAASIKNVLKGGAPIDPFIARRILGLIGQPLAGTAPDLEPDELLREALTERELAILNHVAAGMSDREIARIMALSRWTIDTYIRRIYRKLAVHSRTQAVQTAREHGLLR